MSLLRSWVVAIGFGMAALPGMTQAKPGQRTPVLVELFTSEGCSSCPPADALLRDLATRQPVAGAEIIILGEHVDYWDELGWHDRFSSPQYTARQQAYARRFGGEGPYTPQMVVDGKDGFVGSDDRRALLAITRAVSAPKLPLMLSVPAVNGQTLSAAVNVKADGTAGGGAGANLVAKAGKADLFAALVDPEDVTEVRRGENGGKRLLHAGVVRVLARVGSVGEAANGPLRFSLTAPAGADVSAMRVVVFAESGAGSGTVLGAAMRDVREPPVLASR